MSGFYEEESWDAVTRARIQEMNDEMEAAEKFNRNVLVWSLVIITFLFGFLVLWAAYP